jgi:hypothetical protein
MKMGVAVIPATSLLTPEDLADRVERGKVDRRTAELEIQRATEIVTRKAAQSSLTRLPVVVVPPSS